MSEKHSWSLVQMRQMLFWQRPLRQSTLNPQCSALSHKCPIHGELPRGVIRHFERTQNLVSPPQLHEPFDPEMSAQNAPWPNVLAHC